MVVDGIAKFQALKFSFQGLKFPVKSLVLLVRRRTPQKFQALKSQISGSEIWRFHPPPFHTPSFACLKGVWIFATSREGCMLHCTIALAIRAPGLSGGRCPNACPLSPSGILQGRAFLSFCLLLRRGFVKKSAIARPALSGGMDWWRMEWPFSRV